LFRKEALLQTRGYRSFFGNEWEEEDLSLQLLSKGWRILFLPDIVAHHRLSHLNRNQGRNWKRNIRNRLWGLVIHMPLVRLPVEFSWKLALGAWDAIRLLRFRLYCGAIFECVTGLAGVWRLRDPLSALAMRRYDALRLHPVLDPDLFQQPPKITLAVLSSFFNRWRNRARNQSVWHSEKGDMGRSHIVMFAHEHVEKPVPINEEALESNS